MTIPHESPNPDVAYSEKLLPLEKATSYDASLEELEIKGGLAPGLTDGLKSDALLLRLTGLPVTDSEHLDAALESLPIQVKGLITNLANVKTDADLPVLNRTERRAAQRRKVFTFQNPGTRGIYENYRDTIKLGCLYDTSMYQSALSTRLTYFFEGMSDDTENMAATQIYEEDIQTLFGNENPKDISNERLVTKIREAWPPDHTKETLDKRFADFTSLAQVGLAYHMSIDLLMMARMGNKVRDSYVQQFVADNEHVLLGDDLNGKFEIYRQLARTAQEFSSKEQGREAKMYLEKMSGAALSYANTLEKEIYYYARIYDHFGYQKPNLFGASIADEAETTEPEPTTETAVGAVAVAGEVDMVSAFQKLEQFVLPPDATTQDIDRELTRIGVDESSVTKVQWQRLRDLAAICGQHNGRLYRSKQHSLGEAPPYFVAEIVRNDGRYAIAESPVYGNATYIIAEKHVPGTWQEVLELSKPSAVSVGARRVRHTANAPYGNPHIQKILTTITDLSITEGLA